MVEEPPERQKGGILSVIIYREPPPACSVTEAKCHFAPFNKTKHVGITAGRHFAPGDKSKVTGSPDWL